MDCRQAREQLAELARGALEAETARATRDHAGGCPECGRMLGDYRSLVQVLDTSRTPAPEAMAVGVRTRVLDALAREAAVPLSLGRVGLAVAGGLAFVLLHAGVLYGRVDPGALSPAQLVAVTALGSALAIGAFCWVLGRFELGGADLSVAGLFALATSGLGALGILLCPQETYFALWETTRASQVLGQALGPWASYGAFGLLYGLPPALAVAGGLGERAACRRVDGGLLAAAAAVALWLPATYVQCSALSTGLLAAWALGALAGITAGGLGGLELRRVLAPVIARHP